MSARGRLAAVSLVLVGALLVAALAGAGAFYKVCEGRLTELSWHARIMSVVPSRGCLSLVHELGQGVVGTLMDVAGGLNLPGLGGDEGDKEVDELPQGEEHAGVADEDTGSADKADEPKAPQTPSPACDVAIDVGVEVSNPLPVGMDIEIVSATAKVARSTLSPQSIEVSKRPVWAESGDRVTLRVGLKLTSRQLMVAAGGLMMTRKVRIDAQVVVRVSALGGLIEREHTVEVVRALTIADIIGGVDGTVGAQ